MPDGASAHSEQGAATGSTEDGESALPFREDSVRWRQVVWRAGAAARCAGEVVVKSSGGSGCVARQVR